MSFTSDEMYSIYYINFSYGPEVTFNSIDDAVAYARSACFEAAITHYGETVGVWSPINGYRKI